MSIARRLLQIVAFICTLLIGAAAMAVVVSQTAWFKDWMRGFIVRQATNYLNGELSIGRLDGNLLFGVELEDVELRMNGKPVVQIKDVGLDYSVFAFASGDAIIDDIRLNEPVIHLERTEDGWNLARLVRARTPQASRRRPIEIGEIGVSAGSLFVDGRPSGVAGAVGTSGVVVPARVDRLDASVGVKSDQNSLVVDIAHLSLRMGDPSLGINALSGVITRTDSTVTLDNVSLRTEESSLRVNGTITTNDDGSRHVDVMASSDKFDTDEIGQSVPALRGYGLQPAFEVSASGPLDRLDVDANARDAVIGEVIADVIVEATGPRRHVSGSISMTNLNAAPLFTRTPDRRRALATHVTGRAQIDLDLPNQGRPVRGTYVLNAAEAGMAGYEARDVAVRGRIDGRTIRVDGAARAYGGRTSVSGSIAVGAQPAFNLTGRASDVDLRRLPAALRIPAIESDLQFTYTFTSQGGVYGAEAEFGDSTAAGASIAAGTRGRFTFGGGTAPSYAAQGRVADLDPQQVGREFAISALAADRFRGRVNATFDLTGSGGGRYPFALDATGTAVDSELFGATFPQLDFTTRFADGDAHVTGRGTFAGLDPRVVTADERLEGTLNGTLDVETTFRNYAAGITVDSIDISGRVNLEPSSVAGIAIDSASAEGKYANREGEVTQLEIVGSDVKATARGAIALNDTGASDLTVHIETPALDKVGEAIGRPLKGGVTADATITGNARELKTAGTLKGSNVGYGDNAALTLSSTFDVTMPDLAPAAVTIHAKSDATFLQIGGQELRQLTADTTYSNSELAFKATAQEGQRELDAEGTATLHPDHQEVHLRTLALRAEQAEWTTVPGAEAALRVRGDRVEIENLRLASGDQRIEADGTVGAPTDVLRVRAENVDLAQLDRLLLGDQRLAGRFDADMAVTGPRDAIRAEGEFTLTQGAFRQFKFESLTGKVDYVGPGLNLDVRLQQSPQAWLTASGYAPLSLFRPNPPGTEGHETAAEGEGVDLQVSTSEIELGVIQGFTTYVTNVTGVLKADVKVSGTGHDPHFEGVVDIRGGTFMVPELGTEYTGLDTRISLTTDSVAIDEMRLVDEHQKVMTIGGTLAVHERGVGAVDVKVTSEDFEVIDNDLADLKLDTNMRVTGELRAPRVEGFVEVETGTVDVARVLELTTADPYATEAITPETEGVSEVEPQTPAAPMQTSLFDAIEVDLGVAVPSNLVLRGTDLRPANAPIDIGDINVTVGGALQVRKTRGARPQIVGEVNTVRGSYTFQGRRFEILRDGRIRFDGGDNVDPAVDIQARRIISGVETFVRVQGSMRMPELAFSSRPPLDQADILSLIVFNVPINELGESQQVSLAERAGSLAGGYLVSGLTRSVANALELDEFEIQPLDDTGGPSLSIGEQVGERLFFRIRQGFGAAEATEFILEYQVRDFLRLQGAVAETSGQTQTATFRRVERGGLDLIFFFSY